MPEKMDLTGLPELPELEVAPDEEVSQPFSVCPRHGYVGQDVWHCPRCQKEKE